MRILWVLFLVGSSDKLCAPQLLSWVGRVWQLKYLRKLLHSLGVFFSLFLVFNPSFQLLSRDDCNIANAATHMLKNEDLTVLKNTHYSLANLGIRQSWQGNPWGQK